MRREESGVEAVMMVRRMRLQPCVHRQAAFAHRCGIRREAVEDQRVAGEHEEQQHALEDAR